MAPVQGGLSLPGTAGMEVQAFPVTSEARAHPGGAPASFCLSRQHSTGALAMRSGHTTRPCPISPGPQLQLPGPYLVLGPDGRLFPVCFGAPQEAHGAPGLQELVLRQEEAWCLRHAPHEQQHEGWGPAAQHRQPVPLQFLL